MKCYLLIICLFVSRLSIGQDIIFEKELTLGDYHNNYRKSIPLVNNDEGNFALLLVDNIRTTILKFDSTLKLESIFFGDKIPKSVYRLGYTIEAGRYHLVLSNEKRNKLTIQTYDFDKGKIDQTEVNLKFENEIFLTSVKHNHKLYILTLKRISSIIKIREIIGNRINRSSELDFSGHRYANEGYYRTSDVLKNRYIYPVKNDEFNPLGVSSEEFKLYVHENKFLITLDQDDDKTRILVIDVNNLECEVIFVDQLTPNCRSTDSNSFFWQNYLFQIAGCSQELVYSIYDIRSEKRLREVFLNNENDIPLKNTPFIKEQFEKGGDQQLKSVQEFLESMKSPEIGNPREFGISAFKSSSALEITIGSSSPLYLNSPDPLSGIRSSESKIWNDEYYRSYKAGQPVSYFTVLFDPETFNHVKGQPSPTMLLALNEYPRQHQRFMSMITVFSVRESYLLGYYNKVQRKYTLRKFE